MNRILIALFSLLLFSGKAFAGEEIKEVIIHEKLSEKETAVLLVEHNRVRSAAGIGDLKWSSELSSFAEEWANYLADNGCSLKHRPASGKWKQKYGENLYMGTATFLGLIYTVKSWENEKANYRYGPVDIKSLKATADYTQLVWKKSKLVGCGKAICSGNMVVICNYDPPGNVVGEKPY